MADAEPPVLLLTTWNDSEAEMVRQLLASYGISCSVASEVPHSILPLSVDGLGAIRVHVPAAAEAEALRILAAHRGDRDGSDAPERRARQGVVVPMPVTVRAATRIDLAGGTLDIWPLFLFLERPTTINVAIDLHALAEVATLDGGRVSIRSDDQKQTLEAESPATADPPPGLRLPARLLQHFAAAGGVRLRTAASVPAGSGLGGSSALAVAIAIALTRLQGGKPAAAALHPMARLLADLEAQVLGIPTGVQDYYPALLGGCVRLSFAAGGVHAVRLNADLAGLEDRLVLVYEGASRSSGISNLDMLVRFLQGEASARRGLEAVARAAEGLGAAIAAGDLDAAGEAMQAEMAARRQISPKVMTPASERLFAAASGAGALASKVCGAGGGGCSVHWARQGGAGRLGAALESAGGRLLPFRIVRDGLLPPEAETGATA